MGKIVFICHPISGDPKGNTKKIVEIIRHINLTEPDVIPLCPYLPDVMALNDHDPAERARGLNNGLELIRRIAPHISECRLYGPGVSAGMQAERELFENLGVRVADYTEPRVIQHPAVKELYKEILNRKME